jgi:hypothetical protein
MTRTEYKINVNAAYTQAKREGIKFTLAYIENAKKWRETEITQRNSANLLWAEAAIEGSESALCDMRETR